MTGMTATMLLAWAVFPALLLLICAGLGLGVARLSAHARPGLPPSLLLPVGFAALLCLWGLTTALPGTAWLAGPLPAGLALAGYWFQRRELRGLFAGQRLPGLALLGVFAVYAAPVVLTGTPTFTGWIKLDDGATWLALSDRLVAGGRSLANLAPSTFEALLSSLWGPGRAEGTYPSGVFPAPALGAKYLGVDAITLLQPYMAFMAVVLGAALLAILGTALREQPALRSVAVFIAAQASLLYGYVMWGGIKEIAMAGLVAAACALAALSPQAQPPQAQSPQAQPPQAQPPQAQPPQAQPPQARSPQAQPAPNLSASAAVQVESLDPAPDPQANPRTGSLTGRLGTWGWGRALPVAVVSAATVAVSGIAGIPWLLIPAAVWVWLGSREGGWGLSLRTTATAVVLSLLLCVAELARVNPAEMLASARFASGSPDIGNLWGKLSPWQVGGIWTTGDFRAPPSSLLLVAAAVILLSLLAGFGAVTAARTNDFAPGVYLAGTLPLALLTAQGGAWVGGKALAIASPALLCVAAVGVGECLRRGWRVPALATAAAVGATVLTGTFLTYREVWLAPWTELAELSAIGREHAGEGPTLQTDYSPYGSRHLLRSLDAQGASELRRWLVPKEDGSSLAPHEAVAIDRLALAGVQDFRTIVTRRSPLASRPPANFELVWAGQTYEVWQRTDGPVPRAQLAGGSLAEPGEALQCSAVQAFAASGRAGEELAYVLADPVTRLNLTAGQVPTEWGGDKTTGQVWPNTSGTATYQLTVPTAGRYHPFLEGGWYGHLELRIAGRPVISEHSRLTWTGGGVLGESVALTAGSHLVEIQYDKSGWRPGVAGQRAAAGSLHAWPVGPLFLGTSTAERPIQRMALDQADELCGRNLDWVALVRSE